MEYNYTAIVLKKRKIGETDRLYTFYTREAGKIQSIGRGIRKPQAKLAGQLETLNQVDLIIARRHGLGNIASAITEQYFYAAKSDADSVQIIFDAISVFERLVDFEEQDAVLFDLLQTYLQVVNIAIETHTIEKIRVVTQGFLFQLLSHLGYHLEMNRCAVSGSSLTTKGQYVFSPDIGGVICVEHTKQARRALMIHENTIKLIRIFFQNKLTSLVKLQVSSQDIIRVEQVSIAFLQWIHH